MAEVHVIGEITSAKNFGRQSLFCKWSLEYGNNWKLISGRCDIQTIVSSSAFDDTTVKWSFPIDFHLASSSIQGWPKLSIQIYHLDWLGRSHLFAYGFAIIPTTPGNHILSCYTWRPLGSLKERFIQYFLGGGIHLKTTDLIISGLTDRYKLQTESMGVVYLKINVILRYFKKFAIEYK